MIPFKMPEEKEQMEQYVSQQTVPVRYLHNTTTGTIYIELIEENQENE